MAATVTLERKYKPWLIASPDHPGAGDSKWPVLQGVLVDPQGWLVGCDGFSMAAVPCAIDGKLPPTAEGESVIVPAAFLNGAMPKAHGRYGFDLADDGSVVVHTKEEGGLLGTGLIAGTYPNWRQHIPEPLENPVTNYLTVNAARLAKLARALSDDGDGHVSVVSSPPPGWNDHAHAPGPLIVAAVGSEGIGVLMPMYAAVNPYTAVHHVLEMSRPFGV